MASFALTANRRASNLCWVSIVVLAFMEANAATTPAPSSQCFCNNTDSCGSPWPASPESMHLISKSWHSSACNGNNCSQSKVIKIGTALSLDYLSKYGTIARYVQQAYTLYFDWLNKERGGININGEHHWVQLILMDDRSEADRVISITEYLIREQGIRHLLSPYGSALTEHAAKVVANHGAVMVAPCAASTSVFSGRPTVFGTLPLTGTWLTMLMDRLQVFSESVAYVYEDLAFSRGVCGAANQLGADRGMKVIYGSLNTGQGKLTGDAGQEEVDTMIEDVSSRNPDLFIACVYDNVCQKILQSATLKNFNPKAIAFTMCVSTPEFRQRAGDAAGFVLGIAPWTEEVKIISSMTDNSVEDFLQMFREQYLGKDGQVPYQAASAFAAASTLVYGIEAAGTTDTTKIAEVLQNMDQMSEFGRIAFDENGQGQNPVKVVQVMAEGKPVVAPAAGATANLTYPKPSFDAMRCRNNDEFNVGRYGIFPNGSCLECSSIQVAPFNKTIGLRVCKKLMCDAGKQSVIFEEQGLVKGGAYCAECYLGYYSAAGGATQCNTCAVGTFQDRLASTQCKFCEPGKFAPQQASLNCLTCPEGNFTSTHGASMCHPCPVGSVCLKNYKGLYTNYTNRDGWFLLNKGDGSDELIKCQHGKDGSACLQGGRCHVDPNTGEPAMEGIFCGKCRKGYGRQMAHRLCVECPSFVTSFMLCALNVVILVTFSTIVYMYILWDDLTKPKNINSVILKQLLNYLGMTTVVWKATNFKFPVELGFLGDIADFFRVLLGTSSPVFAAHAGECFAQEIMPAYQLYVVVGLTWVPMWIVFLSTGFWLYWCFQLGHGDKPVMRSRLMTLLIVNLFLVHPRNTELVLSAFNCKHFDKPRLMMDTTVDCQSQEHMLWQMLGLAGFVFYSLGIPVSLFFLLRTYKNAGRLHKKKTLDVLGFLYSGFEPQFYYFEAVFMFRKVLYQLIVLIPPLAASDDKDDRTIKCMSMLVLAVIFLAIHMACEPYDNRAYFTMDRIEAAMLWSILITLLVQTWLYISDNAYAFSAIENGNPAAASFNRDVRDLICICLVIIFHARFLFLVFFLMCRKSLLSITRWGILEHGFVEIKEDGLQLIQADRHGQKLFSSMFQELAQLLVESREAIAYDELLASLQYMCVNCNYHRKKEALEVGILEQDIDETPSSGGVLGGGDWAGMLSRAKHHLNRGVVKKMKNVGHATHAVAHYALEREALPEHRNSEKLAKAKARKAAKEELNKLKQFTPHTWQHCVGQRFSIEDLHLAMVRLNKDIGRGQAESPNNSSRSRAFTAAMVQYGASPTARSAGTNQSIIQGRMSGAVGGKFSTASAFYGRNVTGESCDSLDSQEEPMPPDLDEVEVMEAEIRNLKAELYMVHGKHTATVEKHKLELHETDLKRQEIVHRIKHHMKLDVGGWDQEVDDEEEAEDRWDTARQAELHNVRTQLGRGSVSEPAAIVLGAVSRNEDDLLSSTLASIHGLKSTGDTQCLNCGGLLMVDAKFCRKCGVKRDGTDEQGRSELEMERRAQAAKVVPQMCGGCTYQKTFHITHCCERCAENPGMHLHGKRCEMKPMPDMDQDVQVEFEDKICRLTLELDSATDTIHTQNKLLKASDERVAELQGELNNLRRGGGGGLFMGGAVRPPIPMGSVTDMKVRI